MSLPLTFQRIKYRFQLALAELRTEVEINARRRHVESVARAEAKRLETERRRRFGYAYASQMPEPAKTLRNGNPIYPIEWARAMAHQKYNEEKQRIMLEILNLYQAGRDYSVRELSALLSIGKSSASNYKRELMGMGLIPA